MSVKALSALFFRSQRVPVEELWKRLPETSVCPQRKGQCLLLFSFLEAAVCLLLSCIYSHHIFSSLTQVFSLTFPLRDSNTLVVRSNTQHFLFSVNFLFHMLHIWTHALCCCTFLTLSSCQICNLQCLRSFNMFPPILTHTENLFLTVFLLTFNVHIKL